MTTHTQTRQIFISHRNVDNDNEFADFLTKKLISEGFEVWIDRSDMKIRGSEKWRNIILDEMKKSRACIFLLTDSWKADPGFMKYEAAFALSFELEIIPIWYLVDTQDTPRTDPINFLDIQGFSFTGEYFSDDKEMGDLISMLHRQGYGIPKSAEITSNPRLESKLRDSSELFMIDVAHEENPQTVVESNLSEDCIELLNDEHLEHYLDSQIEIVTEWVENQQRVIRYENDPVFQQACNELNLQFSFVPQPRYISLLLGLLFDENDIIGNKAYDIIHQIELANAMQNIGLDQLIFIAQGGINNDVQRLEDLESFLADEMLPILDDLWTEYSENILPQNDNMVALFPIITNLKNKLDSNT